MVPSKRPRAPSFSDKHPDEYVGSSDWLPAEKDKAQVQVNNFLELCRFCKKNLRHDEDVFMYGSVFFTFPRCSPLIYISLPLLSCLVAPSWTFPCLILFYELIHSSFLNSDSRIDMIVSYTFYIVSQLGKVVLSGLLHI